MNRSTRILLHTLAEHLDNEPQRPDPDRHVGHEHNTLARRYEEWDQGRAAWYLLLGVRLVNEALEDLRRQKASTEVWQPPTDPESDPARSTH